MDESQRNKSLNIDRAVNRNQNEAERSKTKPSELEKTLKQPPSPWTKANILSRMTFWWMNSFLKLGSERKLVIEDFYSVLPDDDSEQLRLRLEHQWMKQIDCKAKGGNPSLLNALIRTFGRKILSINLIVLMDECIFRVLQPVCLGQLILCFGTRKEETYYEPFLYASAVLLCSIFSCFAEHISTFESDHLGMRIRTAICSLLYKKSLKLSQKALGQTSVGQLINLMSNDASRFDAPFYYIQFLWVAPIQLVIVAAVLNSIIGYSCFIGLGFLLLYIPIQGLIGRAFSKLRKETNKKTDERIRTMDEIVTGVRGIKMYAWEKPFGRIVDLCRKLEMGFIRRIAFLHAFSASYFQVSSKMTVFLSLLAFVLTGNTVTSQKVFTAISLFDRVRSVVTFIFVKGIVGAADANVSVKRYQDFLLLEEKAFEDIEDQPLKPESRVQCSHASAKWPSELGNADDLALTDVSFTVQPGEVLAIVGPVGSGKSTLLHLLLGELPCFNPGGSCRVAGRVAYASQEPWIFSGTILENILCGLEYDRERFNKVIQAAALERDLSLFPHGAGTLVGERGISLSGGQKARVNLARCLYVDADVYLLDDPLSAVDTHVGRQLVDKAVNGFLRGKIRVLVTHQLQYLKDVDRILVLKQGRTEAFGTYAELIAHDVGNLFSSASHKENGESALTTDADDELTELNRVSSLLRRRSLRGSIASEKLIVEETMVDESCMEGGVSWSTYGEYLKGGGGDRCISFCVFLLNFLIVQVLFSGSDYWLKIWTNAERMRTESTLNSSSTSSWEAQVDTEMGIYVYAGLIGGVFLFSMISVLHFFFLCLNSSARLHSTMFHSVLRAPMSFFDSNPVGRILNRFSKDIGCMDDQIPMPFISILQVFFQAFGIVIVIATVDAWLFIPFVVVAVLSIPMMKIYNTTARSVRRLEAICRSPVFSHVSTSLVGLTTLRAHGCQTAFQRIFDNRQDIHSSAWFTVLSASRWYGIRLDICLIIYAASIYYTCVSLQSRFNDSEAGLVLSSAVSLGSIFQWAVREAVEVASKMTSVERVIEYGQLPSEAPLESTEDKKPSATWPSQGTIQFDRMNLSYGRSDRPVLKNVTCSIRPCEKVGIVGRTGAGKSSLIAALFRLAEPDGRILIDNVEIKDIGLYDLRSKISVIPQDPLLFSGTLRRNLDPFDQYDDVALWSALENVKFKESIVDNSVISSTLLDYILADGGSNLSVGQRQLICLARAILRQNRILVLDEATANVDQKTDTLIQTTIRDKFKDCTVLTIAHRLNTIMDSDRVMVLDAGELKEFDEPSVLLRRRESLFRGLVEQTGSKSAAELIYLANKATEERRNRLKTPHLESSFEEPESSYL